ncbi:acyl-CoA carboxylase subunit beta [Shimazuella kribbensis]|uniref:acyl-CoA carboxylase subunit beta n=1 Tax=Shimazuella kribbensis TaxID=139808 RepID=UPI000418A1CD|nr:acyl-CoA carboxylase subunit beta [Shimazuella kribbensis]
MSELNEKSKRLQLGGHSKYHERSAEQGKLFVRKRLELLLDEGSFVEDGLFANSIEEELPADGVITGVGKINGSVVCIMANDSTVKAGSWGKRTVEKIIRIQETAEKLRAPLFYLVDSAGARITDQLEMFPGRRGAGRIFYNQVKLSGVIPQICLLFGPSAAGGAYIPAFCDVVIMVDKNASMYLGSPRMAEMVIGQKVSLEQMGGARMHCSVSGCGDFLAKDEPDAIRIAQLYYSYLQKSNGMDFESSDTLDSLTSIIPKEQNVPFDMKQVIHALVDQNSCLEIKELFAPELITAFGRLEGKSIGIIANQSKIKGGVLFGDSADKAARFITLCDAYQIPLLFLVDVPGFMIGTQVERAGIIRHGAKMIAAMSEATVPKISVIVRKAYGAGLYAMAGPAFEPDCCIALPTAQIAVMGPEAAVNAVYHNQIQALEPEEREPFIQSKRMAYQEDIHIYRLASELIVDVMVEPEDLRNELAKRYDLYSEKQLDFSRRKHPIYPV